MRTCKFYDHSVNRVKIGNVISVHREVIAVDCDDSDTPYYVYPEDIISNR